jgi:hypothetical protein
MSTLDTPPAPAEYSLPRRAIDTFVAPGRLFEYFRERTPWGGPLVVAIVAGMAVVLAVPQELYVEASREAMRQAAESGVQVPDPETMAGFARIAGAAAIIFMTPITAFAGAGLLFLLFSVLGGGSPRYVQYLAVTTHAMLITAFGSLLTLPVQILSRDLTARLSVGLLVPGLEPGTFVHNLLNGLDVFSLWSVVVAALGVSVLNARIAWGTAAAVLVGMLVATIAGFAALAT